VRTPPGSLFGAQNPRFLRSPYPAATYASCCHRWWITLPAQSTKSGRPDERPIPAFLNPAIELYLNEARPVLLGSKPPIGTLWVASTTRGAMTRKNLGTLISRVTFQTLGVDVSRHLFRMAAASTAAAYGSKMPYLTSAILNHTDPRVTEEHYNRATSINAARI
jgi:integrase